MAGVTINMIAEKAGVSRGTVDRVLHNRPNVAPDVRDHVLAIAKLMGYIEPSPNKEKVKMIGVILPGNRWFDDYLYNKWKEGLNDAQKITENLGYQIRLIECESEMPGETLEAFRKLEEEGAAGIIATGMDLPMIREKINSLRDKGIPVVIYNSDISDCKRNCFVGQDPEKSGRVAANMIARHVSSEGAILIVAGNLEFLAHRKRAQGFKDACMEAGIREDQLIIRESHNEYYLTYSIVRDVLKSRMDLQAVYMANESIGGCADALGDEKKAKNIMVVGNDLTNLTKKLLLNGAVDFIVEQNIYSQGYQPVLLMKKLIEIPDYPVMQNAYTTIGIVNAESVRQL